MILPPLSGQKIRFSVVRCAHQNGGSGSVRGTAPGLGICVGLTGVEVMTRETSLPDMPVVVEERVGWLSSRKRRPVRFVLDAKFERCLRRLANRSTAGNTRFS